MVSDQQGREDCYVLFIKDSQPDLKTFWTPYLFLQTSGLWSHSLENIKTWKKLSFAVKEKHKQKTLEAPINKEVFIGKFSFVITEIVDEDEEYRTFERLGYPSKKVISKWNKKNITKKEK